ncbi:hypothetical protein FACS1894120_6070 [Clostridia bacterium]|nr:hypothetical protein FACS1894120_6070 [Clostridia bacterium]
MKLRKIIFLLTAGMLCAVFGSLPVFAEEAVADKAYYDTETSFEQKSTLFAHIRDDEQPDYTFSGDDIHVSAGETLKWNMIIGNTSYKYSVTWFAFDNSIAKVDSTGLITGVSPGITPVCVYVKFKGDGELNGKIGYRSRNVIVRGTAPKTPVKDSSKAVKSVKDALISHVDGFKAAISSGLSTSYLYYRVQNLDDKYYVVNVYDYRAVRNFFEHGKFLAPQFTLNVSKSDYGVSLVYDDKHTFNLTHD